MGPDSTGDDLPFTTGTKLVSCFCSKKLPPFLLECFLFTEGTFTLETSSCLYSLGLYWEFLLGIPPLGILPPDFKGKENNNALH